MTVLDRHNFKMELENHEPRFPSELIEQAREDFRQALSALALSSAVIENRVAMLCNPVFTSAIDTLAVTAKPGTGIVLAINPEVFSQRLDAENRVKALVHESLHVENKHLQADRSGEAWTLACEVMCNHTMMSLLNCGMFMWHPKDEETGVIDTTVTEEFAVNPKKIWEKYRDDLKKQGKDYVSYAEFTKSDLVCLAELQKMEKLPQPPKGNQKGGDGKGGWGCAHADGDSDGGNLPFDQDEVGDAMDEVLHDAMRKAGAENDQRFKDGLKRMFDQAEGSEKASKMWGDMGIGALFGEAIQRRQVKFWAQWLKRQLGRRLVPGRNLVFNRKTVAVDHQLRRDPILAYKGKTRKTLLWVACDTSGSMSTEQLEWVRKHVGEEKNIDIEYYNFDTNMVKIEYGDAFCGRGGTNFDCIEAEYNDARKKPDAVLVLTDGFAPEIEPKDKKRWIWLITQDGDDWPKRKGMSTFKLPAPN